MGLPDRSLGTLPTGDPASTTDRHGPTASLGRAKDGGRVLIEVNGACVLTLRLWSPLTSTWRYPASASSGYQKTFTAAGMDYFDIPPGAHFHLKSDTGSITGYADALPRTQGSV